MKRLVFCFDGTWNTIDMAMFLLRHRRPARYGKWIERALAPDPDEDEDESSALARPLVDIDFDGPGDGNPVDGE